MAAICQITLGWKDCIKLILETATVTLPLMFLVHYLSSGYLLAFGVPLIILATLLTVMWITENQMFKTIRGLRNRKIWHKNPATKPTQQAY